MATDVASGDPTPDTPADDTAHGPARDSMEVPVESHEPTASIVIGALTVLGLLVSWSVDAGAGGVVLAAGLVAATVATPPEKVATLMRSTGMRVFVVVTGLGVVLALIRYLAVGDVGLLVDAAVALVVLVALVGRAGAVPRG